MPSLPESADRGETIPPRSFPALPHLVVALSVHLLNDYLLRRRRKEENKKIIEKDIHHSLPKHRLGLDGVFEYDDDEAWVEDLQELLGGKESLPGTASHPTSPLTCGTR